MIDFWVEAAYIPVDMKTVPAPMVQVQFHPTVTPAAAFGCCRILAAFSEVSGGPTRKGWLYMLNTGTRTFGQSS